MRIVVVIAVAAALSGAALGRRADPAPAAPASPRVGQSCGAVAGYASTAVVGPGYLAAPRGTPPSGEAARPRRSSAFPLP
jgi:hypothetical protein